MFFISFFSTHSYLGKKKLNWSFKSIIYVWIILKCVLFHSFTVGFPGWSSAVCVCAVVKRLTATEQSLTMLWPPDDVVTLLFCFLLSRWAGCLFTINSHGYFMSMVFKVDRLSEGHQSKTVQKVIFPVTSFCDFSYIYPIRCIWTSIDGESYLTFIWSREFIDRHYITVKSKITSS